MSVKSLSPREEQIVDLCVSGFTNDAIANELGLSVGTVNTYWLRIKLKVGGSGRTDTVVRIVKNRAEIALKEAELNRIDLATLVADKAQGVIELRIALALLQLAMDQIKSTVWATDRDLSLQLIANEEYPSNHFGVIWEVGKTVYKIFKATEPDNPAVAAHLAALSGVESEIVLNGKAENLLLKVIPLKSESDEIMGCISILNRVRA